MDASAILALLRSEPGADSVASVINGSLVTSVNFAEAGARMVDWGDTPAIAVTTLRALKMTVVPFDAELALATMLLRENTRVSGLSLGDRACLALATREGLPALTADRVWGDLKLDCKVQLIR